MNYEIKDILKLVVDDLNKDTGKEITTTNEFHIGGQKNVFFIKIDENEYALKIIDVTPYDIYNMIDNSELENEKERKKIIDLGINNKAKRIITEIKMAKKCKNLPQLRIIDNFKVINYKSNYFLYYVEEKFIGEILTYKDKYDLNEIINFIKQIVNNIEIMFGQGYIHRDIKPENIINNNGIYKIIDAGIGKNIYENEKNTVCTMKMLGSPGYCAPEQENFSPNMDWNFKTDLYPVGIIAIEMAIPKLRGKFNELRDIKTVFEIWIEEFKDNPIAIDFFKNIIIKLCSRERFKRFISIESCKYAINKMEKEIQ